MEPEVKIQRRKTRQIFVGNVPVGGDAPISVQSMTNTETCDVEATVDQIERLQSAGADLVRVSVPSMDAAEAFGATKRQLLWKVELPYAFPQIMAGLNQTIMLSLSMVVIAALVGADGLGVPVVRALNTVNASLGFESGLVIVAVAIALDRMLRVERKA